MRSSSVALPNLELNVYPRLASNLHSVFLGYQRLLLGLQDWCLYAARLLRQHSSEYL